MNDKLCEFGGALVRIAAMPNKQFGQVTKLGYREISSQRRLFALLAHDADTWVDDRVETIGLPFQTRQRDPTRARD